MQLSSGAAGLFVLGTTWQSVFQKRRHIPCPSLQFLQGKVYKWLKESIPLVTVHYEQDMLV